MNIKLSLPDRVKSCSDIFLQGMLNITDSLKVINVLAETRNGVLLIKHQERHGSARLLDHGLSNSVTQYRHLYQHS